MVTRTRFSIVLYVHCLSCPRLYCDLQNLWMWNSVTEMPRRRKVMTAAGRAVRRVQLCVYLASAVVELNQKLCGGQWAVSSGRCHVVVQTGTRCCHTAFALQQT